MYFEASYEVISLWFRTQLSKQTLYILDREFLFEQKLMLVYKLADQPSLPETNLFTILSLHVFEDSENDLASVINDSNIDFDLNKN